ncbi:hypothetical protein SDC9_147446 [bioreactor metagenome]|uniref:Uncharacterized protein n=1 Tax=bioreactor metagenome TaxID=1076179 RepID=A0A645EG39_9ZZZZ
MVFGSALTNDNVAAFYYFTRILFNTKAFAFAVSAVGCTSLSLFMSKELQIKETDAHYFCTSTKFT